MALASGLSKLDVESLRNLLEARKVPLASSGEYIKLADSLLSSSSLDARIRTLRIDEIVAIINGDISGLPEEFHAEFSFDGQIFLEARKVAAELPGIGTLLADAKNSARFPKSVTPPADQHDGIAGGGMPVAIVTAKRVLRKLSEKPIQLTAKGVVGEARMKSLADSLLVPSIVVKQQIQLLSHAGLLASSEHLGVTRKYPEFTSISAREQWKELLTAWYSLALPELAGEKNIAFKEFGEYLQAAYPYSDAHKRFVSWIALLGALGLREEDADAIWNIKDQTELISQLIERSIPEQIRKGYLSAHLSLYIPGIIDKDTENALWGFAALESEDIASTWRITPQSIAKGISSGMHPDEITEILREISSDQLPATFKVALNDAMQLAGRIHIRRTPTGSELDVKSEQVAKELLANRGLSLLALERIDKTVLRTIFEPEIVQTALIDSGVFFVGKLAHPDEYFYIEPEITDPYIGAAEALVTSAEKISHESGAEITLATAARIGQKLLLKVRVTENEVMQIKAMPRSVSGPRVRVIEIDSQVEKTLPIKAIESIDFLT